MERDPLTRLERRARRTYETARLRWALARAWPVPVLALLALQIGCSRAWIPALALVLLVTAVGFLWRGGALGRGVFYGFVAGGAPLVLPSLATGCARACSASCFQWCTVSCVVGGIVAGVLVGLRAGRYGEGWSRFLCSGMVIAAITGCMGCLLAGAVGVTGMLAGFVLGAAPVLLFTPRHA